MITMDELIKQEETEREMMKFLTEAGWYYLDPEWQEWWTKDKQVAYTLAIAYQKEKEK